MRQRSGALIGLITSAALLLGSGVAWGVATSSGVGADLERIDTVAAAQEVLVDMPAIDSDEPSGADEPPVAGSPASTDDSPRPKVPDVPLVDATTIELAPPTKAPTSLRIDSVDVTMPVVATGVRRDGQMRMPSDPNRIGWYRFGASPGDRRGSAVLAGHVDTLDAGVGPLAELAAVSVGDRITVRTSDGKPIRYRVTNVERIAKGALPVERLFSPTGKHRLAVITCGGEFLPDEGGYEDNVVVLAVPERG